MLPARLWIPVKPTYDPLGSVPFIMHPYKNDHFGFIVSVFFFTFCRVRDAVRARNCQ